MSKMSWVTHLVVLGLDETKKAVSLVIDVGKINSEFVHVITLGEDEDIEEQLLAFLKAFRSLVVSVGGFIKKAESRLDNESLARVSEAADKLGAEIASLKAPE